MGGSAGAFEALMRVAEELPEDLPASILIVQHLAPHQPSHLPQLLQRRSRLVVAAAADGEDLAHGRVYVAPPDCHLLVERGRVRVVRGPKENRFRPAIDPLFRSAAFAYGPRVIGVVLSGSLGDGAAGLWAVKTCGGVTIVQDPQDAAFSDMPSHALATMRADHVVPAGEMAPLIARLTRQKASNGAPTAPRKDLAIEVDFAEKNERDIRDMDALGKPSAFTCPSCHGSLWSMDDGELLRFRCHVGHAFSAESLLDAQSEAVEDALYSAVRALEEKAAASRSLGDRLAERLPLARARYEATARELDVRADAVRGLLTAARGDQREEAAAEHRAGPRPPATDRSRAHPGTTAPTARRSRQSE
jgi:two-component system chemotaxis response regulator CheB